MSKIKSGDAPLTWPQIKEALLPLLAEGQVREAVARDDFRVVMKVLTELADEALHKVSPQAIYQALEGKQGDDLNNAARELIENAKKAALMKHLRHGFLISNEWQMVPYG
ncbi:MAG: hypothetical protein K2Q12_05135 [Rickettsiales bacterium]|nr:hypothetical protein [Rickettsiales bacterium]